MHHNWRSIEEKWPAFRIGPDDVRMVDVSTCAFQGQGKHEIAIYSFGRYIRLADLRSEDCYPVCVRFGVHFPDYTSQEEPAIGHLRSSVYHDRAGMVEPVMLLAIIASSNGRGCWQTLWAALSDQPLLDKQKDSRWLLSNVETVLSAADTVNTASLPPFVAESRPDACSMSISADDLPKEQFSGYFPSEEELSPLRSGRWAYDLKKMLKVGADGRQTSPERVVLVEDLRRAHDSLHRGQLGWTDPHSGFCLGRDKSSLMVMVNFDSGVRLLANVYWLCFLRIECAQAVADKMVRSYRNTPFDADLAASTRWERDLPFYIASETKVVGRGLDEVYAYSYVSCIDEAQHHGSLCYPMKIGYTTGFDGALQRVNGQFPRALANDARIRFIGRCSDGRATETAIHRRLRDQGRRIETAPGREWFTTSAEEVEELFRDLAQ